MRLEKFIPVAFLLLNVGLLWSCQKNELVNNELSNTNEHDPSGDSCKAIAIDESEYNSAIVDEYEIIDGVIENDILKLTIRYGGGCGTTDYELLTNGAFMESYPVQLKILLSFKDDDHCKALIQRQICFDLSELGDHYNKSYLTDNGTIILRLQDYDGDLRYDF